MKFYTNIKKHKNYVLLIHGFMKNHEDWNMGTKNKHFLEKRISKQYNTIMVSFDIIDYLLGYSKVCKKIYDFLALHNIKKIHIIAHSLGGLYAKYLATNYDLEIHKLILLDSSEINNYFKLELQNDIVIEKNMLLKNIYINLLNHFDELPSIENIKKINIISLLNVNTKNIDFHEFISSWFYYKKIIFNKKNFIIIKNIGHMIHYKKGDLILQLLNTK